MSQPPGPPVPDPPSPDPDSDPKVDASAASEASWSWNLPSGAPPPRPQRALSPHDDFRRAVALTVAGTVAPGLGLILARRRVVGGVILGLFVTVLLVLGIWAAVDLKGLVSIAVKPAILNALTVALVVVALTWVGVVVASHLSLRGRPTRNQRISGGILVGALAFAVAAPLGFAANLTHIQAGAITAVFKSEKDTKSATRPTLGGRPTATNGGTQTQDPWAEKPRLNLLLLGGDDGQGKSREGQGTRTDTVILASIDTKTGDTTMFSLPRNTTHMPFPKNSPLHKYYPNGFTDGNSSNLEYVLFSMYRNVPAAVPKDVLGETDNLGADALKLSVGEALGLDVDYYVLINLQGFKQLVNALGGITVNVNRYIPVGGNSTLHIPPKTWISPGKDKHLDGHDALWFARGRYGSDDFQRMDRQKCVINAIIKQANPANVLARYEDIAKAGKDIVKTDLPQEVLPLMVDLSLRVKDGNIRSIVFKNDVAGFYSSNPDFDLMRNRVKVALGEAKAEPTKQSTKKPKPGATKSANTESEDVESSCGWEPSIAATSQPR